MQLTQVQSLGWEDILEKEIATRSSIVAWKIHWTEEPSRLKSMGSQELDMTYWQNHQGIKNIFMEGRKELLKGSSNSDLLNSGVSQELLMYPSLNHSMETFWR